MSWMSPMKIPRRYTRVADSKKGGFGSAIECKDEHLSRSVLIKEIVLSGQEDRLVDEIRALQNTKSNHIVEIYDIIKSDTGGVQALIEEFLPGDDLTAIKQPIDAELFNKILYQLSTATHDMHECGVVHRDLKPNNMKWTSEKILKVFDFNLAKYQELPASTVGIIGTPGYMAPELFSSPPVIDTPVDIYAIGCVAYYLASGTPPKNCFEMPPTPLTADTSLEDFVKVSSRTSVIINRCFSHDPDDRPSAKELRDHFKKELLFGKHRAVFRGDSNVITIEKAGKAVIINKFNNSMKLQYDGYDVSVVEVIGDVYINNSPANVGRCCDWVYADNCWA